MLDALIIEKTLRVPLSAHPVAETLVEESSAVARQMDAVLVRAGFKATAPLLVHISSLAPGAAMDHALLVIGAVRRLVGDNVAHNVYFKNFPDGVPDTMEFWLSSLRQALVQQRVGVDGDVPTDAELMGFMGSGLFNLLDLPNYGSYQHSYTEMLAAHQELIPSVKDRVTVLHLGESTEAEAARLYRSLAGSAAPLGEGELASLEMLASVCLDAVQPASVPVRENRAVLNAVRLAAGRSLVAVNTVTDVLRLACQVSDGDVSLVKATTFRGFTRAERTVLMAALESVVADNPAKLGDVHQYARRWQRLGERLHPGEDRYADYPNARDVFAVARGGKTAASLPATVEAAFAAGDILLATRRLAVAPGMLARSLDRLLRNASADEVPVVCQALASVAGQVSARVLLSLREHLGNRAAPVAKRVFANRGRRAWVTDDTRPPLAAELVAQVAAVIDEELLRRLPETSTVVVEESLLGVALPLSGKAAETGFGVLPRGSVMPVDNEVLAFFCYWREKAQRTDFDLSAIFLDAEYRLDGQVSYTNLRHGDVVHSGDITSAPEGASEFIHVPLAQVSAPVIVPQIYVYSGENFDEVAESMFGFMGREHAQMGMPFEAATVRARSEMRGQGMVALPVVFQRLDDGSWQGKWTHLYLQGHPAFNRVEGHHLSVGMLVRSILERQYLTVRYLVELWSRKAKTVVATGVETEFDTPVTYLGMTAPEQALPEGSTVITLAEFNQLIPE